MSKLRKYDQYLNEAVNTDAVNTLLTDIKKLAEQKTLEKKNKIKTQKTYFTADGFQINITDEYYLKAQYLGEGDFKNKYIIFTIKINNVNTGQTSLPYTIIGSEAESGKTYTGDQIKSLIKLNPNDPNGKPKEGFELDTIMGKYIVKDKSNIGLLSTVEKTPDNNQPSNKTVTGDTITTPKPTEIKVEESETIKSKTQPIIDYVKGLKTPLEQGVKDYLDKLVVKNRESISFINKELEKIKDDSSKEKVILTKNKSLLEDIFKAISDKTGQEIK